MELGPNDNLLGDPMLMRILNRFLSEEDAKIDPMMQTLKEECPCNMEEDLAYILHYHMVSVITAIDALSAWLFTNKED